MLPTKEKEIICTTCHIKFNSVINYKLHLTTEFHVYNTKRRIADLPPITEDIFEQKKIQMVSANQSALSEMVYKCQACNKTFKSHEKMDEHKLTKKHKKSSKEFQAKHPNVDDDSIFLSISQHQDRSMGGLASFDGDNENQTPDLEEPAETQAQPPRKTSLESLRCCLFCNKEHDGLKKCIDHMRIKHSFTFLDVDCLVDLKGLLTYIATRIQLGQICLFCSKQFSDPKRCQ